MANAWAGILGGPVGKAVVDNLTKKPSVTNTFLENPEYPNSQNARDLWYGKLTDWANDPNYGAVTPDWNNIWDTVQNHIKQYYEGGPLAPGVQQGVSASLARRNMSDNPASDYLHAQIGAQEGNNLSDAATQQALDQANLAESGRQTWLNSINQFQAAKPAGEWQTTTSDNKNPLTSFATDLAVKAGSAAIGGGIANAGAGASNDWLSSILQSSGNTPNSYAPTMSSSPLLDQGFDQWKK